MNRSLAEIVLEAVENWKRTGKLPSGEDWQIPEETDSYGK